MSFLTTTDYKLLIEADIQAAITGADSDVITEAESTAQEEISSYLNQRFDVAAIFAATAGSRNKLLVTYMVDVSLYHIHARIRPRSMPEIRVTRYQDVINWLKMVASGKISPDLPRLEDTDGNVKTDFRFGSNTKFDPEY